uniref:Putative harbinger-4 pst n=1 Tax=Ixodes ricinus TaxID=34613 RepID=A0A147BIK3_IXORI
MSARKRRVVAAALILVLCDEDAPPKKKRPWVKEYLQKREQTGAHHSLTRDLLKDANEFRRYLRMTPDVFHRLADGIRADIQRQNTVMRESISAEERLEVTLRHLASGDSLRSLHYQYLEGHSTVHSIVYSTCTALYNYLRERHIVLPRTPAEWRAVATRFEGMWNYPHCLGAIDGKHINMFAPPNSGSLYFDYMGNFSLVLLAVVDADLKAIYVDVGTNGRTHDSTTFKKSTFYQRLTTDALNLPAPEPLPGAQCAQPYVFVADAAFPMSDNLMRPYPGKAPDPQKIYNYRHSRARRVSENFFGVLAQRFRILLRPIQALPNNVIMLVLACCSLHNMLRDEAIDREIQPEKLSNVGALSPCDNRGINPSVTASAVRDEFCRHFNQEGAVTWQSNYINEH